MKIRPILFSPEMSRAVREGRKTMTRRIVKDEGPFLNEDTYQWSDFPWIGACPYGKVGDILWGRERFVKVPFTCGGEKGYRINFPDRCTAEVLQRLPLRPSIHMPRSAARIWLRITNVRVERVCSVSEMDALAEGIEEDVEAVRQGIERAKYRDYADQNLPFFLPPVESFRSLWESINGPGSWDRNPWVWVIEYEPCPNPDADATEPV
jgi:hypothetical protein